MSASEWDLVDGEEMTGGGAYLDQPGWFHLLINEVRDGCGPNGSPIDGFTIECEVLAGTAEGCAGKKVGLTVWKPNLARGEKSIAMSRRIASAFFVATDLVNPNLLGKAASIDANDAQGKQFVAELAIQKDKDGNPTKFLQFHYSEIYHVDDPEVEKTPKDAEALNIIAQQFRHPADYFSFKKKSSAPKQTAAASKPDDFSDL